MIPQKAVPYVKKAKHIGRGVATLVKKTPGSRRTKKLVGRYKLAFGLAGAIMLSLLLTVCSVLLYEITGSSKLDLSRPGYEAVRTKIKHTPSSQDNFAPTGSLNAKVVTSYLTSYGKQTQTLNSYDAFNPQLLDDAQLGLTDTTVAPTDSPNP